MSDAEKPPVENDNTAALESFNVADEKLPFGANSMDDLLWLSRNATNYGKSEPDGKKMYAAGRRRDDEDRRFREPIELSDEARADLIRRFSPKAGPKEWEPAFYDPTPKA